jgi:hypothetical protein
MLFMSRPSAVSSAAAARLSARVLAALVAVALAAPAARAQTATLTFNGLTAVDESGVRYVNNCYEESGYRITLMGFGCGATEAFVAYTPDNLAYTGSPALSNNRGATFEFTRTGPAPGAFSFQSIGLAGFIGGSLSPKSVLFTGMLAGGGMVTQTVNLPGSTGLSAMLSPFTFTGFTNLSALRITVQSPSVEPYVQFDNVAFVGATNVVPEPATVVLFGAGLAGLGAAARRRRARG